MSKKQNKEQPVIDEEHIAKTKPSLTFTEREYGSNDGMLTAVWGPGVWHFLHTMSFNYPMSPTAEQKKQYRDFILQLKYVLPCGKCRKNLTNNLKKMPLRDEDLENRETFSRYLYNLHETVNTMLHKKSGLTYDEVRDRYENFRARCASGSMNKTRRKTGGISNRKNKKQFSKKKESGCTEPMYEGKKAKCVLSIVPLTEKCPTLKIDKQCLKKRIE